MKFIIAAFALIAVATAQQYSGEQQQQQQQQPRIVIRRQAQDTSTDGAHKNYETANGIAASENGSPSGAAYASVSSFIGAQAGLNHYTAPDGTPINVTR